jgi:hypothetical protein
MPHKVDRTSSAQGPSFTENKTLVTQLAQCAVCNPMKVMVLIMHFELSREEHLLSMRVEELAQLP